MNLGEKIYKLRKENGYRKRHWQRKSIQVDRLLVNAPRARRAGE